MARGDSTQGWDNVPSLTGFYFGWLLNVISCTKLRQFSKILPKSAKKAMDTGFTKFPSDAHIFCRNYGFYCTPALVIVVFERLIL